MKTKCCRKCMTTKNVAEFYKHKLTSDGYNSHCKSCVIATAVAWKRANLHSARAATRKWNTKNPKKLIAATRKWKVANLERNKASARRWSKAHPAQANLRNARHRARKLNATPVWANQFFIAEIYDLAQRRTKMLGFDWHVDHIIPLNSKLVCGLHVENNLRVVPGIENARKGNRHWPDMPA